jgi:chemotaxis protein methyltransferase CheR
MSADEIARVLRQRGERWVIDDRYRRMVMFAPHNLAQGGYPPQAGPCASFDLILCRNVFIYFDEQTIARVTSGLAASLADGGWLLTGPHDPPLTHPELVVQTIGESVVYRRAIRSADHPPSSDTRDAQLAVSAREHAVDQSEAPTVHPAALAREAFAAGRYEEAVRLTSTSTDEQSAVFRVQALANARGSAAALAEVDDQLRRHSMSASLHLVKALLLIDVRRMDEAAVSLRHTLYLDPASAIATALLRHPLAPVHWLPEIATAALTQTDRAAIGPGAAETT